MCCGGIIKFKFLLFNLCASCAFYPTICFAQQGSSMVYTTHISYLEIYNEIGYDLLDSCHEASRLEDLPSVFFYGKICQTVVILHYKQKTESIRFIWCIFHLENMHS